MRKGGGGFQGWERGAAVRRSVHPAKCAPTFLLLDWTCPGTPRRLPPPSACQPAKLRPPRPSQEWQSKACQVHWQSNSSRPPRDAHTAGGGGPQLRKAGRAPGPTVAGPAPPVLGARPVLIPFLGQAHCQNSSFRLVFVMSMTASRRGTRGSQKSAGPTQLEAAALEARASRAGAEAGGAGGAPPPPARAAGGAGLAHHQSAARAALRSGAVDGESSTR